MAAAVAAAVVSVSVAAAVVSTTAAEDQGQPLVGSLLQSGVFLAAEKLIAP